MRGVVGREHRLRIASAVAAALSLFGIGPVEPLELLGAPWPLRAVAAVAGGFAAQALVGRLTRRAPVRSAPP
jgi:hypothetical protein